MPALSAEDRARRAAALDPQITTDPVFVTISRAPSGSNRGGVEQIAANVPMQIWPATGDTAPNLLKAIPVTSGARIDAVAYAERAQDVTSGDEIATPTTRYKVVGRAPWNACIALALSEVVPR